MSVWYQKYEPVTKAEMDAIPLHPAWSDGRDGYMYCRIEAVLDHARMLRAEITWDDDSEDAGLAIDDPLTYFGAQLMLESNRPDLLESEHWITFDTKVIHLTKDEAFALVAGDPALVLEKYAAEVAKVKIWTEADGYPTD